MLTYHPDDVYQLDPSSPLLSQVLTLAGWYQGRTVDISGEEEAYRKAGLILTDFARKSLAEFYLLKDYWCFRWD